MFTLTIDDGSCPITSFNIMQSQNSELTSGATYDALGVAARTDLLSGISINTQYDPAAGDEALDFVHTF